MRVLIRSNKPTNPNGGPPRQTLTEQTRGAFSHLTRQTLVLKLWLNLQLPQLLNLSSFKAFKRRKRPNPAVIQIKIRGGELNRLYWMNPRMKLVD